MKFYGELKDAQLETKTGADPSWSDHVGGIWWNSTDGKVKVADGTLIRALLRNDQKMVIGNSGTAADNIRLNRGASELLQFLLGSDSTAEGSTSDSVAQVDLRVRNWTTGTRPTFSALNKGRMGFNTSTGEIEVDDGSQIIAIGGGGGSVVISDITAGENIPTGTPVYIAERNYIEITSTTNTIPMRKSSVNYPATIATGVYLMDTQKNIDAFVAIIQAAVTAAAVVGSTVTVTFSQSTRKFTLTGSTSIDIMWNSQTTNSAAAALGYSTSGDDSGTTHTADSDIDSFVPSKAFMFQCHADWLATSYAFAGFTKEAFSQYDTDGSIYKGEIDLGTHNDGQELGELYIAKAAITIDSTNNKIDFNDGSDRNVTITSGTYLYPYDTLCTDIQTVMDGSASALTFTVTYSPVTDKFTIVGSSAYTLEWATGTNTATAAHTTLGWTAADTASATTQTSTNAVQKKGRVVGITSSDVGVYSRNVGFAVEQDRMFAQLNTQQTYTGLLPNPGDWAATPSESDLTEEGTLLCQHENASGYGVREFGEDGAGEDYHIQYKTGHGAVWRDATTLISTGASVGLGENLGGSYHFAGDVFVDENNKAVLVIPVYIAGDTDWRAYAYYSNDLDTWTKATGGGTDSSLNSSSTISYFVGGIYIRQAKCAILIKSSNNTASYVHISDDSGSGYTAFTQTDISSTAVFEYNVPSHVFLQYFPAEAGVNKHRVVICGRTADNNRGQIAYTKGDGSSAAEISEANTFVAANSLYVLTAAMDQQGDGNIINYTGQNTTSGLIYRCVTTGTYSGGTMTTSNFAAATINPNGTTVTDTINGYSSGSGGNLSWNKTKRGIVLGSKHYCLFGLNDGRELYLSYSIDAGTTYSSVTLHNGSAAQLVYEYCMFYIASNHKIVVAYKFSDASADNLTEGKIYAATIGLSTTGVPTLEIGFTQIDGGQAGTVFNGFLTGSASTNAVNLSWEHYSGARDVLWSNRYI